MVVVGYSPAQGKISNIIVKNSSGQVQTLSRSLNWFVTDRWVTEASAELAFRQGFIRLPKPIEFEFFTKNIDQFE
jgi:hypothetical protein